MWLRFICRGCKKPFKIYRGLINPKFKRKYCNRRCAVKYKKINSISLKGKKHFNWKDGRSRDHIWKNAYQIIRKYVPNPIEPPQELFDNNMNIRRKYHNQCEKVKEIRSNLIPTLYVVLKKKGELNEYG